SDHIATAGWPRPDGHHHIATTTSNGPRRWPHLTRTPQTKTPMGGGDRSEGPRPHGSDRSEGPPTAPNCTNPLPGPRLVHWLGPPQLRASPGPTPPPRP